MLPNSCLSANSICSAAAGIAGNVFALVLFMSPIPTFRRIVRNQSTEQFLGSPYIYTLLNSLICLWYGLPLVSPGVIMVATVNGVGVVFQAVYITVFIVYASKARKLKMLGLSMSVLVLFLVVVIISLQFFDSRSQQIFVGYLSIASLISMFASPLFIIKLVIKTRSVEYIPFYLSLDFSDEPFFPHVRIVQSRSIHLFSEWNRDDSGNNSTGVVLLLQECIYSALERALNKFVRLIRSIHDEGLTFVSASVLLCRVRIEAGIVAGPKSSKSEICIDLVGFNFLLMVYSISGSDSASRDVFVGSKRRPDTFKKGDFVEKLMNMHKSKTD